MHATVIGRVDAVLDAHAATIGRDLAGYRNHARRVASFCQSAAKWPVSYISTWSPGLSVLASAASQAPVPEAG